MIESRKREDVHLCLWHQSGDVSVSMDDTTFKLDKDVITTMYEIVCTQVRGDKYIHDLEKKEDEQSN